MNKGRPVGAADHGVGLGEGMHAAQPPASHQKEETLEQLLNAHFKNPEQPAQKYLMEVQINLPL